MKTQTETQTEIESGNMKNDIINHLDDPRQLEQLYQENKPAFKRTFNLIYSEIQESVTARIWSERLNYRSEAISLGSFKDLIFIILLSLMGGLVAKIPEFASISEEFFYPRNISFIVFPALAIYFASKQRIQPGRKLFIAAVFLVSVIYINLLPDNKKSDTLILACIHMPLFLWASVGIIHSGNKLNDYQKRLEFLRYNGDLVVMTTIIIIAGVLLSAITMGLFRLIDLNIEWIFERYITVFGAAAAPIVGTFLVKTNPHLVNKVSPVVARIFTPIVLLTLIVYLVAVIVTGKDPYNDREFLLIFNLLLIGVMLIILFSIAETTANQSNKAGLLLLSALSVVTIIVNGIALSAILFRISEWGITPNRLAVLGGNILILLNLLIVTYRLLKSVKDRNETELVERSIAAYIPVYIIWAMLVTFAFPVIFCFI